MKSKIYRGVFYVSGLLILALGITLNTKTDLGVSPIISVAYSISQLTKSNFGNVTLLLYTAFVIAEMIIHFIRYRKNGKMKLNGILFADILQIPLSIIFTRFLNIFSAVIPEFSVDYKGSVWGSFGGRIVFLIIAIILTGVGAAMSLDMRLIPNPGDGIVQTIADAVKKETGLIKNIFDVCNILFTISISLIFAGKLIGIGVGTVFAVIGVGRVIAIFNRLFLEKMKKLAGITEW